MTDENAEKILDAMLKLTLDPDDSAALDELVSHMLAAMPSMTRQGAEAHARRIMEIE